MNYVIWNNKDSRDINGLLICELPPITKPKMRVKETVIDGVDGSIIEELGYEPYDKSMTVGLKIGADVDEIIEYFTGSGEIIFSNEPNKYYKASIINGVNYDRLLRYRKAIITFRVQPFKYDCTETELRATSASERLIVSNIGNYKSKPIITVKGSGKIYLIVNGTSVCDYEFPNGDNTVIIDSEKQDAYFGSDLKNRTMNGEFPVLDKGENILTWGGNVESISVKNYSRWL